MAKESKYKGDYYRKRVKCADGKYHDVYGKTKRERDLKAALLQEQYRQAAEAEEQKAISVKPDVYVYEYAAGWYARKAPHLGAQMKKSTAYAINNIICPVIGNIKMADITLIELTSVMSTIADKSQSYNKQVKSVLTQIFDEALEAGIISRDPTRKLKAGGVKAPPEDALTPKQQTVLLDAVKGQRIETFVMLCLYAGLRREEACGLCWDCVELDSTTPHITVRRAVHWPDNNAPVLNDIVKSKAAYRTIPLNVKLADYLKDYKKAQQLTDAQLRSRTICCDSNGETLTYSGFRSQWNAIKVRSTASGRELGAKVPKHNYSVTIDFDVHPHKLRHTFVTDLILGGMDLKSVQYIAGHSDPTITIEIYTALMGKQPEDIAPGLNAAMDARRG